MCGTFDVRLDRIESQMTNINAVRLTLHFDMLHWAGLAHCHVCDCIR